MDEQLQDRSGETVEKFKLERLLGEGGMGQVYLAQHQITDRWVAVKILHQEFASNQEILARIRREAKAAALIGHPNIVEIIDSGTDKFNAPFIAMELLEGESLDDFLENRGPLPVPLACHIVADICDTLTAAHEKGVVHRDMKPENVFMQNKHKSVVPQVKILDFGISKFLTMDQQNMSLTRTGTVMGTPYYMSVEQAMGQKVDGRADIYSVGVILYQLLTSRLPYYDTNYNRVLLQIVAGEHVPVIEIRPDLPPALSDVIQRAMTKNRDERYSSCGEFREALLPFFENEDIASFFGGAQNEAAPTNTDIPLQTATPQIADPSLISAALASSSPGVTQSGTGTTGEVVEQKPKSKALFVVLALVVLGLGVGGYFLFGPPSKDEEMTNKKTPVATNPTPMGTTDATMVDAMKSPMGTMDSPMAMTPTPPAMKKVKWVFLSITGQPAGAKVMLDGKKLTSPYKVPRGDDKVTISVTHRHYRPFTKTFVPNKSPIVIAVKKVRKSRRWQRTMRTMVKKPMPVMVKKPMPVMVKKPMSTDVPDF